MKNLTRFILALLLIMAMGSVNAQSTLYVPGDYATIQAAINAATSGDIIEVDAGNYAENVNINKSLTVRGPNYLLKGNDGGRGNEAVIVGNVKISKADVNLEGFTVQTGDNKRAIDISVGSGVLIQNNIIDGLTTSTNAAIWYGGATGITHIEGNLIQNFTSQGWKIMFDGNDNSEIYFINNELANMYSGIIFQGSMENSVGEVKDNLIYTTGWPAIALGASSKLVSGNEFTGTGIYITGSANPAHDRGNNNIITHNIFTGNGYYINVDNAPHTGNKVNYNAFLGTGYYKVRNGHDGSNLDATCNWYGTPHEAEIKAKIQGDVKYFPYKTDAGPDSCLQPSFKLKIKKSNP
ncbi:MAG: hypothetical protein WBJ84_09310 [Bacteroidales bacterium]